MTVRTRGFAALSPEKRKEVAAKGGRAAHEKGTAHRWSPTDAKGAQQKGAKVRADKALLRNPAIPRTCGKCNRTELAAFGEIDIKRQPDGEVCGGIFV